MRFRDRFYTPQTAKAILGWPILIGVVAAAAAILLGAPPLAGIAAGLATYALAVWRAMPRTREVRIDPFTVQEPWRQFVQGAQRSASKLHETVDRAAPGPTKDRLLTIVDKLDAGMQDTWQIARGGDEIDDAVTRLDPTSLRSKLDTLRSRADDSDTNRAIESVESQLASVDRLKAQSARTANTLRLTQTRLDELVARAAELSVGAGDTDAYEHDVEDLVVELEALRQAVQETRTA